MITITAQSADLSDLDTDVIAVGVFKGGIEGPGAKQVLDLLGLEDFPVTPTFRGDVGQTLRLAAPGHAFGSVLLVGLGRMDGIAPDMLRRAAGEIVRAVPSAKRIATTLAEVHPSRAAIEAVADGLRLGSYTFTAFRSDDAGDPVEREGILLLPSSILPEATAAIERSRVSCDAVAFARDLVNTPPGDCRPEEMAQMVVDRLADRVGDQVRVVVRDETWMAEQGCGAMLGVSRGSAAAPRLVELTYEPDRPLGHVVLVGKGITFDTGGLNLKPGIGMMNMKDDMAGAAAVAAVIEAVATLGARVTVTGLLGLVENAIGADAQRPSDVVTTFGGTTVEIGHTDAEGRLVLADVLGYGASLQPDVMIDLATLTGTAVAALGPYTAALLGGDEDLVAAITAAAQAAGEQVWRLPLSPDLDSRLDSGIADMNHIGPEKGPDTIMAALFLQRFTEDVPWAHLDIAGPAFLSKADARGHTPEGGTGFGVTTLLAYLQQHTA